MEGRGYISKLLRTMPLQVLSCPLSLGSLIRQRLHERGFICNRIVFDAVMPSVYTTPTETVAESGSI